MALDLENRHWKKLADNHRAWLAGFYPQHLANWEKLLRSDSEATLCEAAVRLRLQFQGVTVEPNESLTGDGRRPDFRCSVNGKYFYVEVTCILIATVDARIGPTDAVNGVSTYPPFWMSLLVFNECVNKADQCGNLDAPALVAVGTLRTLAAMLSFTKLIAGSVLTSQTKLAWDIDMTTGQQVGETFQLVEFENSAFLKPDRANEITFARSSISGVLLCGGGNVLGVLHPNPARPFDRAILPTVDFGQVEIDRDKRELRVSWLSDAADGQSSTL